MTVTIVVLLLLSLTVFQSQRLALVATFSIASLPDIFMTCEYESVYYFNAYFIVVAVVVALLFYVHGKHLRSCRDGQLT